MPTKMFTYDGRRLTTWNLFTGCGFNCTYCWARKLAEGRLKRYYPDGFISNTHFDRFDRKFKPDDFVFVISMGDIAYAPSTVLRQIEKTAALHPDTRFLLCTKHPIVYRQMERLDNIYFGVTLETNRNYPVSKAYPPQDRYISFRNTKHKHKFVSLEPLMDFDSENFARWLLQIQPEIIEIGADNYRNNLPEPTPDKVSWLVSRLKEICPTVILKDGLTRLL